MGGRGSNGMERLKKGGRKTNEKSLKMPWETDPRYQGDKNAKLNWLRDHPESKYNDPDFISGIKRIEYMADRGASAEQRREALRRLAKGHNMSEAEVRHFIASEFL